MQHDLFQPAQPDTRQDQERLWLDLTRRDLPPAAREARAEGRPWPVHFDHCFQRILLDHACGARWYDVIAGRPAYAHAPAPILTRATQLGQAVLEGREDLAALNRQSLTWRGKRGPGR